MADLPGLAETTRGLAYCRHHIAALEARRVCPDCGSTHGDLETGLAALKDRERDYAAALDAFGARPR